MIKLCAYCATENETEFETWRCRACQENNRDEDRPKAPETVSAEVIARLRNANAMGKEWRIPDIPTPITTKEKREQTKRNPLTRAEAMAFNTWIAEYNASVEERKGKR